jgi:ribonuclease HII
MGRFYLRSLPIETDVALFIDRIPRAVKLLEQAKTLGSQDPRQSVAQKDAARSDRGRSEGPRGHRADHRRWCRTEGVLPTEILARLEEADVVLASDEAGLGAYAGPLVVSAVLAPKGWTPRATLTDSKKMSDEMRKVAARALIADERIWWGTYWTHPAEIDEENVYYANVRMHTMAMRLGRDEAASRFPGKKIMAVVDGNLDIPGAVSLPKADMRILACSAASVLAKVARDTWMAEKMAQEYPGYGFENHKGYGGNREHDEALAKLGPCPIHRRSFAPIAKLVKKNAGPNVMDLIAQMDDDPV